MQSDLPNLPPRQAAALHFIRGYYGECGSMPTVRELAENMGLGSPNAAAELIEKLIQRGFLHKVPGIHRGLRLSKVDLPHTPSPFQLPLLGRIAAGKPLMSGDHIEEILDVSPGLFRSRPDWLFRVEGHSMQNIDVLHGDLVAVREDAEPPTGSVVAALVADPQTDDLRLTLKRFKRRSTKIVLLSENDDQTEYPPQVYDPAKGEIRLVGRYVGLIRPGDVP